MGIVLGPNRYGKAENRVVRIVRDTPRHEIRDLNVSTSLARRLRGGAHRRRPVAGAAHRHPEEHRVRLREEARHRLARGLRARPRRPAARGDPGRAGSAGAGRGVRLGPHPGRRCGPRPRLRPPRGRGAHDHRRRDGGGRIGRLRPPGPRRAEVHRVGVQGVPARRVHDPPRCRRPDPRDRAAGPLALPGRRRHRTGTRRTTRCARCCSRPSRRPTAGPSRRRSTRWAGPCWRRYDEIAEISFAAPNKHHFLVDLAPFGLENPGEVFIAADRPYGLIEATVTREEER